MQVQSQGAPKSPLLLVEQVMEEIRGRITSQRLAPGTRLPSIRKLAQSMGVSKSTIVDAYDRLVAEEIVHSKKGSGFFVAGPLLPLALAQMGPKTDRDIDPLWVSRQSLEAGEAVLKPGCGWLPASWMPQESIRRALRGIARSREAWLSDYGTPEGSVSLREFLVRRLAGQQISVEMDQVLLTTSGTQTIDLLCRFFIEPGDTVLVDDPCYFNYHALLKAHRVKVVGVPYTRTGPDLELFEKALREHKPRLYITNSAIHNPTGAALSPATGHGLLKLAEHSDIVIIEDDIFGDMETRVAPRLAALDGLRRVIQIGSFSKTLSAAFRCGYVAARRDWIEGLTDLKIATSFGGEPLSADLTWRVLKDGCYRKHLDILRRRLSGAMQQTCGRLLEVGIEPWLIPQAGMYVWGALPEGARAADVARKAHERGVILAPGNVFGLTQAAGGYLRFNVAQSSSPKIFEVLGDIL